MTFSHIFEGHYKIRKSDCPLNHLHLWQHDMPIPRKTNLSRSTYSHSITTNEQLTFCSSKTSLLKSTQHLTSSLHRLCNISTLFCFDFPAAPTSCPSAILISRSYQREFTELFLAKQQQLPCPQHGYLPPTNFAIVNFPSCTLFLPSFLFPFHGQL